MKLNSIVVASIFAGLMLAGCRHTTPSTSQGAAEVNVPVVMKKWSIEPSEIRVPRGATVHLRVTTADVQHGFDVKALDISEPVDPRKTTDITFKADKPGRYEVECGILCGRGHDDMGGKIVVE